VIGRSVVVGVDGSAEATDAVVLGRRLAQAAGGRLHLVAAAPEFAVEVAALRARLPLDRVREVLLSAATERAIASLEGALGRHEVEEALTVRLGRAEHVLSEVGRVLDADLVVLGGRRHKAPASWFERGTAHHLLRMGERPVLVTGPDATRLERVLAAVDLSFATEPTVAVARRLAELIDAPLEVLHVARRPELPPGLGLDLDFDAPREVVEQEARRELAEVVPPSVPLTVRSGEVVPSVCRVVEDGPPTLLVLGAQGRGWSHRIILGSTTESLLERLPCSLVVAPCSPDALT
jgi:nucleotide-binding universal stress UspA family protein